MAASDMELQKIEELEKENKNLRNILKRLIFLSRIVTESSYGGFMLQEQIHSIRQFLKLLNSKGW